MRTKSLFLPGGPFCHHICRGGDTQGHLAVVRPFVTHHFCCGQCTCHDPPGTRKWMPPPVVLAWEAFQKTALLHPEQYQRKQGTQTKVLVVRNWKSTWDAIRSTAVRLHCTSVAELEINLGCHQVYPCASPLHLGGRTGRREWGACAGEGQTKSEWGREASVESPSAAPARAGRDASVERSHSCRCSFFPLLQMGAGGSRTTPLKCILKTGTFDPQCLKRHA